ncbi:epigen-like [Megalops cyprinoides]|uniref:epigen-like n=1 Tax=Megalops cyprinoides TaxID=118141 RepID=UPI001864CDD7|nr:epigen-like [Megalops cyprinoides]
MRGFTSSFVLSLYGLLLLWPNIQSSRHSLTQVRNKCPTSDADSEEMPEVLKVLRPCPEKYQNFCIHGQCSFDPDLDIPVCSCVPNYAGERCQHLVLQSRSARADPEKLNAIGVAVVLLLCGLIGGLYCCVRKRCEK